MAHAHHNHAGHGHHHGASDNIKVAFFLNLGFTLLEIVGGLWINSVAILSDALHDLGDSLSLGLAWYFEKVAKRERDEYYTFGYKRFSLLGAVINSVILLVGSFFVLSEAIPRILDPQPVNAAGMVGFAILGILVNGAAALRLKSGESLNQKAVRLHLLEDVLGWVAVLAGGIVLYFFDFPVIDPLLSVAITLYVLYNVIQNLRQSMKIFLQATPSNVNLQDVTLRLEQMPDVKSVHDLHVWTLDGTYNVLTLHAVVEDTLQLPQAEELKKKMRAAMADMDIQHITVELEASGEECSHQGLL
ncbi:cobalt-zinc-cadmium efflux system protein [Pontibacter ummariensis]|uniref:Cobalt-zinc-cadmium efflux system protein n=1 Tax=Pontibacter ummariensis TaxID=1610492 RepID=A0A239JSN1_9BACT|nr:cation diffusion facilitator family transporter [Pontibacter ummariensis]PRY07409.1 cobalt-zinc-cadmium efflux system protein [Pontibacter ummariensis]SNT08749.1 cobalt-zinc-cadmium efflux system protein [Pontibacter ummariensis]